MSETTWTPEIVRARFVEAAHTERFLPGRSSRSSGGYWPQYFYDEEDKDGWDDAARMDNAERKTGRAPMGAVSRHAECLQWTAELLSDEKRRHIVWSWAFCRANGWDFGARCVRKGWARPTAYRRLNASMEAISAHLVNDAVLLRLPDDKWLRHETPSMACISGTMGRGDETAPTVKIKPGYRTEPHRDTLDTPEKIADFAKALERRNAKMRKLQSWRDEGAA